MFASFVKNNNNKFYRNRLFSLLCLQQTTPRKTLDRWLMGAKGCFRRHLLKQDNDRNGIDTSDELVMTVNISSGNLPDLAKPSPTRSPSRSKSKNCPTKMELAAAQAERPCTGFTEEPFTFNIKKSSATTASAEYQLRRSRSASKCPPYCPSDNRNWRSELPSRRNTTKRPPT